MANPIEENNKNNEYKSYNYKSDMLFFFCLCNPKANPFICTI